jgi:hypothetical protein
MANSNLKRKVKITLDERTNVVELRIFLVDSNGRQSRALGVANFELEDLFEVVKKLHTLASDVAETEANWPQC